MTLDYAIKDAKDLIGKGSPDFAAWILLSFLDDQLNTVDLPVCQDVSALVDALIRAKNSLSDSSCLNLLLKHRSLLEDSVINRGSASHSARLTAVNQHPTDDFESRIRSNNCDAIFANVKGEASLSQELLSTLKTSATIKRRVRGCVFEFRLTHAFTSLAARDDFHIRHDLHYSTIKSSTFVSGSGTLHEHRTVISSCRYIKDDGDSCDEVIFEFYYSNFGAVLMYERVTEEQVRVFSSRHSHAQLPPGLSKEKRALVRRLAAQGEPSQSIMKRLSVSSAASKRQVQHAIRAVTS